MTVCEQGLKMVQIPSTYSYNFWINTPTEVVEITCLMPNGVVIPLETNRNAPLAEIKEVSFSPTVNKLCKQSFAN